MKIAALTALALLTVSMVANAQITITYLRHAESGHNVVYQFKDAGIPTNQWPSYVGNENAFSPLGEQQAAAVATNLMKYSFDLIAVSPKWRTRNTILPYLKATGQKAEIWPELAETQNTELLPTEGGINPDIWQGKSSIKLSPEEASFFSFRADSAGKELAISNRAEAVACAQRVESLLRERFADKPARVLLLGHGNSSRTLIRHLSRDPQANPEHMNNTHIWVAEEQQDHSFAIQRYNETP